MPSLSPKLILSSDEARAKMLLGVTKLAQAVGASLGPRGRTVVLDRVNGTPLSTKDGYSIAKEISFADAYENIGAQLVREVAQKTVDVAGDGTTTATILAHAIYRAGVRLVAAGANPTALKRGIDLAVTAIVGQRDPATGTYSGGTLATLSQQIAGDSTRIAQVGTISANSDSSIGAILAEAMQAVGTTGVVTVEESRTMETQLEIVEGMQFDRGWLSPYFVTNAQRGEATYEGSTDADVAAGTAGTSSAPLILLLNRKLSGVIQITKEFLPFLERAVAPSARPLVIIAEDVEHDPLNFLITNKLKGLLAVVAVKSPGFGDRRKAVLDDLAILTGATIIGGDLGVSLAEANYSHLGQARVVTVNKEATIIIGGAGDPEMLALHILDLKRQVATTESEFDREKLAERLAKLTGGVAVIKVGAATESEMKEKKARVEDAMYATKAAVAEGIVPGGGTALIRAVQHKDFADLLKRYRDDSDVKSGIRIIYEAAAEPLRRIVENAGTDPGMIVDQVRKFRPVNDGYDAATGEFRDMMQAGIIDPTKVTRTALQSAASIAGLMLTTEALVVDDFDGIERLRRVTSPAGGGGGGQQGHGQQGY